MALVARSMGGTYDRHEGFIHLPKELTRERRLPFQTLTCLYRKYPCGMSLKDIHQDDPAAGRPCVSFDVIPNVKGDPRRSRFYRSFQGDVSSSKRLFNQFVGWLAIIGRAVKKFHAELERGRNPSLRVAMEKRVARTWLAKKARDQGSPPVAV